MAFDCVNPAEGVDQYMPVPFEVSTVFAAPKDPLATITEEFEIVTLAAKVVIALTDTELAAVFTVRY
jgi:hypothetical protein